MVRDRWQVCSCFAHGSLSSHQVLIGPLPIPMVRRADLVVDLLSRTYRGRPVWFSLTFFTAFHLQVWEKYHMTRILANVPKGTHTFRVQVRNKPISQYFIGKGGRLLFLTSLTPCSCVPSQARSQNSGALLRFHPGTPSQYYSGQVMMLTRLGLPPPSQPLCQPRAFCHGVQPAGISTTAGTWVDVGLSCTMTTTGRPINVHLSFRYGW